MSESSFKYRIDQVPVTVSQPSNTLYHITISEYDKFYSAFFDYFKIVKLFDIKKYSIPVKQYFKRLKYIFIIPEINKVDEEKPFNLELETLLIYKYRFKSYDIFIDTNNISDTWADLKLLLEMISA